MDWLAPLDWGRESVVNAGEGLGGLLGGDFTRQNLLKLAPGLAGVGAGLLTGGTWALPAAALAASLTQGVGKQFAPTDLQAQTTQDLVTKLGGDPESTLQNLGVGFATDPWLYAGLGMGSRLARGAGTAGKASKIASAGGRASGAGAALEGGIGAGEAAGGGSRLSEMLSLRRGIGKVQFNPAESTITARAGRFMGNPELDAVGADLAGTWEPGMVGVTGGEPNSRYIAMLDDPGLANNVARETGRHELYHGLVSSAVDSGRTAGLSPLQRLSAKLYSGGRETGTRQGLALLTDELGAHAAESSSPLSQLLGGGKFLFGGRGTMPRQFYADQFRGISPSVGKLYDLLGYAPEAAKAGGLGAAGVGSYALGRQLFGE